MDESNTETVSKPDTKLYENKKEYQNCSNYIQSQGFRLEYCKPDGNCFYHTLEHITKEPQHILRQLIVTHMKIQRNLYKELFTDELKMKYFIHESNLDERLQTMSMDKSWAGFLEKISSSLFLKKNIFELYQSNLNFHWNVFFGSSDPLILEKNTLENVFIHYNETERHFSPLTPKESVLPIIKIANIYCLLAGETGSSGVFIQMTPDELNPNHEMFQNLQQQQHTSNKPVGLENTGNTCYFSALVQSLCCLPIFMNAIHLDNTGIRNEHSFVNQLDTLFQAIDEKESLKKLRTCTLNVLHVMRQRFGQEYEAGKQADPSEFFSNMKMIIDEKLMSHQQIAPASNFSNNLESYKEYYESCNQSQITRITTIYVQVIKRHVECKTETFEGLSSIVLQFNENTREEGSTTVDALLEKYVEKVELQEPARCSVCQCPNITLTTESVFEHLPEVLILTAAR